MDHEWRSKSYRKHMQEVCSAESGECDSVWERDSFNIFLSPPTNPERKQDCKMCLRFCKSVSGFGNNTGIQALLCSRHLVGFHKRMKCRADERSQESQLSQTSSTQNESLSRWPHQNRWLLQSKSAALHTWSSFTNRICKNQDLQYVRKSFMKSKNTPGVLCFSALMIQL